MIYTTSTSGITVTYSFPTPTTAGSSSYRLIVRNSTGEYVYTDSSIASTDTALQFSSVVLVSGLNQLLVQGDTDGSATAKGYKTIKSSSVTVVSDSSTAIGI